MKVKVQIRGGKLQICFAFQGLDGDLVQAERGEREGGGVQHGRWRERWREVEGWRNVRER